MGEEESAKIQSRDFETRTVGLPSLGLMALVMGISVSNPFYAQSLLPSVEKSFGLKDGSVLLGPTATQLGMAMGYLLLLPLGDGAERRRMLTLLALGMALACLGVCMSPTFGLLLIAWFVLGLVALIPALLPSFLAAFTPESHRGRMLGIVISGQFGGILLSRSVSGAVSELWGWRSIYAISAIAMIWVAILLRFGLPPLPSTDNGGYWNLQISMFKLWRQHSRLRSSCLTQALLFGSFMAIWSAVALHLAAPPWRFGPAVIGSLGLVGFASILAAPMVGRLTDHFGPDRIVTSGIIFAVFGILILGFKPESLPLLALGLMMLDVGVQCSFVANQARIYAIDPKSRSRMSSQLFLTAYLGAAASSAAISYFWDSWHWPGTCLFGILLVVLALVVECRQGDRPLDNQ